MKTKFRVLEITNGKDKVFCPQYRCILWWSFYDRKECVFILKFLSWVLMIFSLNNKRFCNFFERYGSLELAVSFLVQHDSDKKKAVLSTKVHSYEDLVKQKAILDI